MQVQKAQEFLRSCCRVCLAVENEMVDTVNIVENFNKSIAQLLLECANIEVNINTTFSMNHEFLTYIRTAFTRTQDTIEKQFPALICEDCTTELVLVAKFREKCAMSSAALLELTEQIEQESQSNAKAKCVLIRHVSKANQPNRTIDATSSSNGDEIFLVDGYDDDDVEYVVLDGSDHIEDAHMEKHSSSPDDDEMMESGDLHMQKTPINHFCKLCGAGFAQANNLQRHLLTHSESELNAAEQFTCTQCNETFAE